MQLLWLVPSLVAAALCASWRVADEFGSDANRIQLPVHLAAMRRLFPDAASTLNMDASRGGPRAERAQAEPPTFREWMRTRSADVVRAPDQALLAVASARLRVLLAAQAEDPKLCLQYARAPIGGIEGPASAPSSELARAIEGELVAQVYAARAGADHPVERSNDERPWARSAASALTLQALRGSRSLNRRPANVQCAGYVGAYRIAASLPPSEGAAVVSVLIGRASAVSGSRPPTSPNES